MINLLRAGFARLKKSKVFWLALILMLIMSAGNCIDKGQRALANSNDNPPLEYICFDMGPFMPIFVAAFVSLFLGTEYSDGAMRTKLVVGKKRTEIYLSNFVICTVASLIFCIAWHIGSLAGIPFLGVWQMGAAAWLINVLLSLLFTVAICAIFSMISHLWSNKALVAVAAIILALFLVMAGSYLYNSLLEPEELRDFVTVADAETGEMQILPSEPRPNPDYVSEPLRTLYTAALNILPTGQAILMANTTYSSNEQLTMPLMQIFGSFGIILLVTAFGIAAFERKDIK